MKRWEQQQRKTREADNLAMSPHARAPCAPCTRKHFVGKHLLPKEHGNMSRKM